MEWLGAFLVLARETIRVFEHLRKEQMLWDAERFGPYVIITFISTQPISWHFVLILLHLILPYSRTL